MREDLRLSTAATGSAWPSGHLAALSDAVAAGSTLATAAVAPGQAPRANRTNFDGITP